MVILSERLSSSDFRTYKASNTLIADFRTSEQCERGGP